MKITIKSFEVENDTGVDFEEEAVFRCPKEGEYAIIHNYGVGKALAGLPCPAIVLTPKKINGEDYIKSLTEGTLFIFRGLLWFRHVGGITSINGMFRTLDNLSPVPFTEDDVIIEYERVD